MELGGSNKEAERRRRRSAGGCKSNTEVRKVWKANQQGLHVTQNSRGKSYLLKTATTSKDLLLIVEEWPDFERCACGQSFEAREIRTPNLLIWSQTRYRCAIAPLQDCVLCRSLREGGEKFTKTAMASSTQIHLTKTVALVYDMQRK